LVQAGSTFSKKLLIRTERSYNLIMKSISFVQLVDILKNNKFDFYYNNPRQRHFKSEVVIDSNSISYKHGIITEKDVNHIYLFDNQFIALKDYKNYKDISINLLTSN
jgi:hypothetical protein